MQSRRAPVVVFKTDERDGAPNELHLTGSGSKRMFNRTRSDERAVEDEAPKRQ